MRKTILLVSTVIMASCGVKTQKANVIDGSKLTDRLEVINQNMVASGGFQMNLQARLNPPTLSGLKGQSTSIHIQPTKAYVSFNVKGPENQKGAVTVINTSTSTPAIEKEIQFLDRDVNYVKFENNKFNIVGARAESSLYSGTAFFQQFTLDANNNVVIGLNKTVPSYAANYLTFDNNYFYISSGDTNGGFTVLNKTDATTKFYSSINDSRSIGIQACGKEANILTGSNAKVVKFSKNKIDTLTTDLGVTTNYNGANDKEARSEIVSGIDYSIISLGAQGFQVICNSDMSIKASISVPTRSGVDQADIRTNGVSAQKGLIFAAQGGAGLYIYSFKTVGSVPSTGCQNVAVVEIGHTDITAGDSVNSVSSNDKNVFTSNGKGGVEIFSYTKTTDSSDDDASCNNSSDVMDFDAAYQATTCQARQMIEGCDSVKELSILNGIVNVPAKTNDKECYALKIVNYQSNKTSTTSYTQKLSGVLSRDHDAGGNSNPRIMSATNYTIKMADSRNVLLSGSKYGLDSYYVDNYLLFKLTSSNTQYYAMGTGDSTAIGFNSPAVNINNVYTAIPFDIQAPAGVAQYSSATLLSSKLSFPINTAFTLDSYALDAGVVGQTDDMWLIFR